MIIQRRADQLQPGDILPASRTRGRRVVTYTIDSRNIDVITAQLSAPVAEPMMPVESFDKLQMVDVEARDTLTPAQQHADELRDLLAAMVQAWKKPVDPHDPVDRTSMRLSALLPTAEKMLAEITPKPPTLDEALHVLEKTETTFRPSITANDHRLDDVHALLDRARKAGML